MGCNDKLVFEENDRIDSNVVPKNQFVMHVDLFNVNTHGACLVKIKDKCLKLFLALSLQQEAVEQLQIQRYRGLPLCTA